MKAYFKQGIHFVFLVFLFVLISKLTFGQQKNGVKGIVLEESSKGNFTPLFGASVFWLGSVSGTTTDSSGYFFMHFDASDSIGKSKLIIRYLGFESDTIENFKSDNLRVILASQQGKKLMEVTVEGRALSSIQMLEPMNTTLMTGKELLKAACCNLSESFETNPTVEVTYSDAVTGAKQIQMLGLSGNYILMTQENLPGVRGIMSTYGLAFTPGPWIESIQVTKGTGSVANGYESLTGQINVELKKPDWSIKTREKLYLNAYANSMGRFEINVNSTQKLNKRWFVTHLVHGNTMQHNVDFNKDGFMDMPMGQQINAMQRWRYDDGKGISAQFGLQTMFDFRKGGQFHSNHHHSSSNSGLYEIDLKNKTFLAFGKTGYIFPSKKYKSIGLMQSFSANETHQNYGEVNQYHGNQKTYYANLIYQSIIGNSNLKFRIGTSFRWEKYQENVSLFSGPTKDSRMKDPSRTEIVPGAFGELTWNPLIKLSAVGGLRIDHRNLFGVWLTPRLHLKYEVTEKSIVRISTGSGRRLANIFAENSSLMASSRTFNYPNEVYNQKKNGLLPEYAWNYGLSWNQGFVINNRDGSLTIDAYRTDFQNQVIVDLDQNPLEVNIYNLSGKSYSNAIQVLCEYEIIKRFDVRLAYKWLDVNQTLNGKLQERPFVARDRFFVNLAYKTRSKWTFDATLNWNGVKRIPNTKSNPVELQFPEKSPAYWVLNAQVSKSFGRNLEFYIGGENLFDFRQRKLINNPENPFGTGFDASMVWGPVIGRMGYVGIRWTIK